MGNIYDEKIFFASYVYKRTNINIKMNLKLDIEYNTKITDHKLSIYNNVFS